MNIKKNWFLVDAKDKILGRLSSKIIQYLQGKHKSCYERHKNNGDYIIIINADKIKTTGKKYKNKIYYSHSGYPGGLKSINFKDLFKKSPEKIIEKSIKGMLPKNSLGKKMFKLLKIYKGNSHPHTSQKPKILNMK